MKHNWEYKQLGEIGVILTGSTPSTSVKEYYDQSDYMFVKPGDIEESGITYLKASETYISELAFNTASRKLPKHSVLVTCIGTIGKVGILQQEATCNQQINAIIPAADNIYYKYLAYAISSIKSFLISKKNGPVVPIINKTQFSKFKIPVPPMEVQEQIVAELDKINETIGDCRELLRNLDALAQSLFYDTFGDPTTFHNRWEISTLGENCTFIGGGTPSKSNADFYSGNIPWATVRDMSNFLLSSTELKITEEAIKLSATNLLPKGTIVISTHVGLGKICKLMQDTAINQDLKGVILNERLIDTFFVYWYLNMAPHIIANGRGATVKGVTLDFMRSLKIPVPPLELQEKFAERIEQIEEQKKIVENTIAELQTLLDSRMDYWFN